MIIVSGWIRVDAAERDRYVAECVTVVEQARAAPGCHDFAVTADPIEPDRVLVYERWASDEEVERFRGSGPSGEQQAQILDASVRKYRISAVEDP